MLIARWTALAGECTHYSTNLAGCSSQQVYTHYLQQSDQDSSDSSWCCAAGPDRTPASLLSCEHLMSQITGPCRSFAQGHSLRISALGRGESSPSYSLCLQCSFWSGESDHGCGSYSARPFLGRWDFSFGFLEHAGLQPLIDPW